MIIPVIQKRYDTLSESACCLSCGSAVSISDPKLGEVCVDLGSGRGIDVLKISEIVGENGHVYGIDISEGMIRAATRNAEKIGAKNVSFIFSELENIPLPESTAHLVISNCVINHASDKQKVWNEVYRILKKGGRIAISDIYSIEKVPEKFATDPIAVAECWAGAVTKDEYLKNLITAGFTNIQILEESIPYVKGEIRVSSFTITALKPNKCACCS